MVVVFGVVEWWSGGVVEWWSEWYVVVVRSFEVGGRWRSFDSSGERKARTHYNTHTQTHRVRVPPGTTVCRVCVHVPVVYSIYSTDRKSVV